MSSKVDRIASIARRSSAAEPLPHTPLPRPRPDSVRRELLRYAALAVALSPFGFTPRARAAASAGPLLSPSDPAAKKVKYVEDASMSKQAGSNKCATCSLYQGSYGSAQGPCQLFPNKEVKAGGWCSSWSAQM